MFAVQMELTPKARHTKLQYILPGCNYSTYLPFSLYTHARVELQSRARRLFSIVNLIIRIHRRADIAGFNSQRMLSQP